MTHVTDTTLDNSAPICFNGPMETNEPVVKTCGCGCGVPVKRTYLPGHDARHKAALVLQANQATTRQGCDRAIDQLVARGWAHYAERATLRAYKQRYRGKERHLLADVAVFLVGPDGTHHSRHACGQLTQAAKAAGHNPHPITKLAPQAAITRTRFAPQGWDACPQCTVEHTLDELVEWHECGKQVMLAIYDEIGLTKLGNPKPSHHKHRKQAMRTSRHAQRRR